MSRGWPIAAVALVAAVLGGVVSLLAAHAIGLTDEGTSTVYVPTSDVGAGLRGNEPVSRAQPLVGNGFSPRQIYAARSRGVLLYCIVPGGTSTRQRAVEPLGGVRAWYREQGREVRSRMADQRSGGRAGLRPSSRRLRIGLALGSGGARGWAHVGILRALDAAGVTPDVVAGTSIGALIAGVHLAGRVRARPEGRGEAARAGILEARRAPPRAHARVASVRVAVQTT